MNSKRVVTTLLLFLISVALLHGAIKPEGINYSESANGYSFNFTLEDYAVKTVSVDGEYFTKILVDGYGVYPEAGYPALPIASFNLAVPYKLERATVKFVIDDFEVISLDSKVYPFQSPWEKSKPIADRPFTINRDYYLSKGTANHEFVETTEPFVINGIKGITVNVSPFSYNPSANELTVVKAGHFEVISNGQAFYANDYSEAYNEYFEKVFINYEATDSKAGINYLIITAPQFEAGMADFVNYKNNNGYQVTMVTTDVTGTTTSSIKSYIQGQYDNALTKPEFILLVGDVNVVPCWNGSGNGTPSTDLNYVQLEGDDYYADAFIGRFSVADANDLANAIHKTTYMESHIGTFEKNNVFMASVDNSSITEGTHNHVIENYFEPEGYDNVKLYQVTYNATSAQVTTEFNAGKVFGIYSGHGATTYWADGPQFTQDQVEALTNDDIYPFVFSFACVTGEFDYGECFSETWLRTENGASGFYGSSVNSYWDEDDILEKELIDAWYNGTNRLTPMMDAGKLATMNHYGGGVSSGSDLLRYLEMYNLMGDPAQPTVKQIPFDDVPPTAITDLATGDATSNSIELTWTAPMDTTFNGVTTYDIRYATTAITNDSEFEAATSVVLGGQSDEVGTQKEYTLTDLDMGTEYYFAVKALDIWNNTSAISNSASGSTYGAPEIAVNPEQITRALNVGQNVYDTVYVQNVSENNSTLDYTVALDNNTFPENVKAHLVLLPKEAPKYVNKKQPLEVKGGSIKGFGGPDAFGYEWIDSDEENGPEFEWNDISSTGTTVSTWTAAGTYSAEDEGYFGPIDLGFDFKFYGETENQIYLSTNGFVTFDQISGSAFSNTTLPDEDAPNGMLCAFWDDLKVGSGSCYYKVEDSKVTIQYSDWEKYSGSGSIDFQIVIFKSGKILYHYNDVTCDVTSATIGIENQLNTIGLNVVSSATYLASQKTVQISAEPDWLATGAQGGTLYNGSSAALILEFMTEGLEAGQYGMDLIVSSNDPDNSVLTVPVTMYLGNTDLGWEATVSLADNEAKTSLNLTFGTDPLGTDGLDEMLGENELPPLPPTGVYDARFILPGGEMASLADYRGLDNATYTWTVKFQPNSTYGYPMHFNWNRADLPTDGMVVLRDKITGSIVNVDMTTASYYEVTNENITELEIVYTKMNMAEMNVSSGWNILSVPVHTPDMTVANMFPAATSEAFEFANGYQTVTEFEMGKGYWLKFDADAPHQMYGQEESFDVALNAGWNLVAGFNETVAVSDVTTNPAGIVNSVFYMFQDGYVVADELTPGYGYWVKASEAGDLVLNVAAKKGKTEPTEEMDALYTISMMVSDNGTGSYALGLGLDPNATEGIDSDLGETELPPMPPTGVFDARLMLPDGTTSSPMDYRTGDAGYSGTVEYDLSWQYSSGADALTLDIVIPEVPGTVEMTIVDGFGGAVFSQVVEEGTTQVVVDNANLSALNLNIAYTAPIPVELTGFAANVAGESINLEWSTATETNNKGFEVERSEDGENFSKIAFVDGMGTTTEAQSYIFTDRNAVGGTYYYRLRQVDFDGTYAYSDVVEVEFVPSEYSLQQNYPNPFNPSTTIKFALPVEAKVTVTLYNALGQRVNEIVSNNFTAGVQTVNFNASELASGMYIYQISAQGVDGSNFVDTKKMMLMK